MGGRQEPVLPRDYGKGDELGDDEKQYAPVSGTELDLLKQPHDINIVEQIMENAKRVNNMVTCRRLGDL